MKKVAKKKIKKAPRKVKANFPKLPKIELATFGGGCFWHVQLEFSKIPGVIKTEAGYMGGKDRFQNPTYEEVCTDKTGHAEVVQITFDPKLVSYFQFLEVFFKNHDPTQLNRQGPDVGSQYRSIIFYNSPKQKKEAQEFLNHFQQTLSKKIMTLIEPAKPFYIAEDYHQNYLVKKGLDSCMI